jgi:hypothetical protein
MNSTVWTIDGTNARLEHGCVQSSLDLGHCGAGLRNLVLGGAAAPDIALLELQVPRMTDGSTETPPVDAYVRQNDLVATYEQTDGDRLRLQAYWRAVESPADLAEATLLELVVSVQTDLLDSDPATHVASRFSGCTLSRFVETSEGNFESVEPGTDDGQAGFVLLRLDGDEVTIMQAAHPSDSMGIETIASDDDRRVEVRHPLFAQHLEKGVIRRARLRVAVLPRTDDVALAAACYREFAKSEPMLTV